ncbi:MAG TPA: pyrimidine reductase family protein [Jatrophihabitantaceae bacterium]|jgi:riboflavin biosynthesis pyrimidine reductase|nr:pyrimidine reductase family protein [Jatrophihabitantaceae bacterium]
MERMRALLPEPADDVDVHECYARDWLDGGGIRMNFVASVDGAATEDGVSRGLQTPGDNRVFAALRDLADVVLAGAGTVRTEGYHAIGLSARRTAIRRDRGLAERLPTAVVSRSLRLDPDSPLFTDAPPDARTIVLTCASGDRGVRAALERVADVVVCGDSDVDFPAARAALVERGLTRILSEGGPTLFAEMARAGVVDELCLSVTPLLTGPGARRIVAGQLWPGEPLRLALTGLLEEHGALFCRYRVRRDDIR